jgi:hypothetical protein
MIPRRISAADFAAGNYPNPLPSGFCAPRPELPVSEFSVSGQKTGADRMKLSYFLFWDFSSGS